MTGFNETFMKVGETTALKMAVVEYHKRGVSAWYVRETLEFQHEGVMDLTCKRYADDFPQYEFRWRYGWLTLDPSDKCETFKSE